MRRRRRYGRWTSRVWRIGRYNIAGLLENYVSLKEFHEAICRVVPEAGSVEFTGASHSGLRVSIDRIRDDIGFEPRLSVEGELRDEYARGRV